MTTKRLTELQIALNDLARALGRETGTQPGNLALDRDPYLGYQVVIITKEGHEPLADVRLSKDNLTKALDLATEAVNLWRVGHDDLMRTDQYGDPLPLWYQQPPDLETLAQLSETDPAIFEAIYKSPWYEINGDLYLEWSEAAEPYADEIRISEIEGENPNPEVYRIADSLKRWTPEDGFYHA